MPVERAAALKNGLPIRILSSDGSTSSRRRRSDFISPHVDDQTQSMLVKGMVQNPDGTLRAPQYVRARIVWKTAEGLVVPVTAVLRINGQFFAFVAEGRRRQAGREAARDQGRPDRRRQLPGARRHQARRARRRRPARRSSPTARRSRRRQPARTESLVPIPNPDSDMFVDTFIRRPILASVCSLVIILAGAHRHPDAADRAVPGAGAAAGAGHRVLQRRRRADRRNGGHHAARAGDQRRRGHAVHDLDERQRRHRPRSPSPSTSSRTSTSRPSTCRTASRRPKGRLPNEVKQVGISVTKVSTNFVLAAGAFAENDEYDPLFISNYVDRFVNDELKRVPGVGDVFVFGERPLRDAAVARSRPAGGRSLTADEVVQALREQNVQVAAGRSGRRPRRRARPIRSASAPRAGSPSRRSSTTSS